MLHIILKCVCICMYVCSASGQHPAVGNMGKLCRRMLQMRNERAALLRGQVRATSLYAGSGQVSSK